ncbi:vomeronasal type-1 receptor 90-like [Lepus europaeus]|uniref:vomeronasal type-1 receptor 90-like n=1 Tax=Lepus europaeus TaxID=9983 RepID=UPI002B485010|nr:vomeronasal type-1 receptor 90-like [Lepus europaeus]
MNTPSTYAIIDRYFLVQFGIGISANSFLFLFHIVTLHQDPRSKPMKLITCHLALVHEVMLLTAVPLSFMDLNFWDALKCKALFYTNRVMRDLSICVTCLLSVIQAVTISPSTSYLVRCKHQLTNYIICILTFFWCFNLSFSSNIIFLIVTSSNMTQNNLRITKHCSLSPMNSIIGRLYSTLTTFRDVFLVGVMLLSSVYMVTLLSRHQRRSQHLHSTSLHQTTSPEKRATQTILLLVSAFVVTYCMNHIVMSISVYVLWTYNQVLLSIQKFALNAYATISPLVLLSSDKRIVNILKNIQRKCC